MYSLLGTDFGGDGKTTFNLPDLRGRAVLAAGNALYAFGKTYGAETVTLDTNTLPSHTHEMNAISGAGNVLSAFDHTPAALASPHFYNTATPDTTINPKTITSTGVGQPHPNMQPYVVLNYIIAIQGVYPPRA